MAPARGRLRASARSDRIGRRDHEHVRRGSGPLGRDVGKRPDQERHELFRGSAFEYFYDEALKSRPYFLPATEQKPEASQHQFGGTLGGPILRNKAFFFGSYQGTFDRQVANRFGTVPTAAMRNGDFSASPTPIYDPATGAANGSGRTAFSGNIIPRERFDPIVQKLIAGLPLPNLPGLADNYFATGDYTFD